MQLVRDAASLMILLLLVLSVRFEPYEPAGDLIPPAHAAAETQAATQAVDEVEGACDAEAPRVRVHRIRSGDTGNGILLLEVETGVEALPVTAADTRPAC
ncbi:MAG: hypothetical protein GY716_00710 [bacterium]|nr:hypothetical protein [bacterium]